MDGKDRCLDKRLKKISRDAINRVSTYFFRVSTQKFFYFWPFTLLTIKQQQYAVS